MYGPSVLWGSLVAAVSLAACAGTPGAAPHDMSVEGHERAAASAESAAGQHGGQFDPAASAPFTRCSKGEVDPGLPCWTAEANPTQEHLAQAEGMRKAAADHRAASLALRDAEASACVGLAEADRDTSPLTRPAEVTALEDLFATPGSGKVPGPKRLMGAAITLQAVSGLTKEYLQRLVTCHLARNAAMGHSMHEMATCPLAVKGATATVESVNGGFRVDVRSDEPASAAEISRRAKTLGSGAAR